MRRRFQHEWIHRYPHLSLFREMGFQRPGEIGLNTVDKVKALSRTSRRPFYGYVRLVVDRPRRVADHPVPALQTSLLKAVYTTCIFLEAPGGVGPSSAPLKAF